MTMALPEGIVGDASPRGSAPYRRWLSRTWSTDGRLTLVVGMNPSKATEERDDQMTRFLVELLGGLTGEYACRGYVLVNCCDVRNSKAETLNSMNLGRSDDNFAVISVKLAECDFVVASWGTANYGPALEVLRDEVAQLVSESGKKVICFNPKGLPVYCSRTNAVSRDKRWTGTPVPWVGCGKPADRNAVEAASKEGGAPKPPARRGQTVSRRKRRPLDKKGAAKRRTRTKREIARDIAFVLNVPSVWLSPVAQQAVIKNAMWAWTEADGKYEGCIKWSQAALGIDRELRKGKLVHEHAVPRNLVLGMLRRLAETTPGEVSVKAVSKICKRYLHGVVVTKEEDCQLSKAGWRKKMPPDFDDRSSTQFQNPFLRYEVCGITLVDCG